ncbi:myelin protein P0 isoform X3 [Pteropus medius]|uniref:myelin protein P0 isoform X3 n=1 Tax=Pteropus vampyrus TaxID=132908 RepID=UPI00196B2D40|nr:myelin protein P0 isoform X3 [Pteropus giganteus]
MWEESPTMQGGGGGKNGSQRTWSSQETQPMVVRVTVDILSPLFSGNLPPARRALGEPSRARRLGRNPFAWPQASGSPAHLPLRGVCLCPSFRPPSPPPNIPAQGRGRPTDTEPSVYGVVCVPHPPPGGHNAPSAPCAPPSHHLSTAHARLQLVTRSGQPPHTKAPGDFKQVPGTSRSAPCPPLSQPRSRPGPLPAPAMAPGAPSPSPSPVLAALLFSSVVLSPAQAIVVYTDREVHGAVGSRVTLHCSFWSSEWVSDDISFTWRYQPEGGRDAISIFHYAKGQPYIDEVGTFKERIQWVGDPRWKDGSIVIHNLDYSDNGTFTCDVKNPPDIVGKTSQVTLYVFEKVPWRRGNCTSSGRTRPSAAGRRRCCMPCWTTAEAPKRPVRRSPRGWGSLARIRNSG